MATEKKPIYLLASDEENAREIGDEKLEGLGRSMVKLGDLGVIVWNERSGKLVTAHQRMDRLREAGAKDWVRVDKTSGYIEHPKTGERFPIRIVDWDEVTARMANIAANNPELQGEFTDELQEQLAQLEEQTAFEELRLRELMEEEPEARERRGLEEFETAPPPKKAWIMIATSEDLVGEIEAELREKWERKGTRIEVSVGAR